MRRFMIAFLMAALIPGDAEAKWLRADTENFIVYSEGSEKSLREFAENLQRFDATLRLRFKVATDHDSNRLTVYLVPRASDAGRLATGAQGSSIAGFYRPAYEGSYAVAHRDNVMVKGTPQSQQVLFHEYSHHFMRRYLPGAFPSWFIEGFAEFYSTVDFTKDGRAEIGKPPYARAYGLLAMPKIPVSILLAEQPGNMRNRSQKNVYYGRSWLLTHMFFSDSTRSGQLAPYIDAINSGDDPRKAASDAFGDLDQLDKDLNRYLNRPLDYRTTGEPVAVAGTISIQTLSEVEGELVPLHLERLSAGRDESRVNKVRESFRELSKKYADDARIWYELAMAEWEASYKSKDRSSARAAVERALAIDPKHVRANVLLGWILSEGVKAKPDAGPADWNAARKPLVLANRIEPNDPMPLYAYFRSFLEQGIEPPPIAIDGLERSFTLAPENTGRRVSYAFALANRGDIDAAISLVRIVAFDPHDDGEGEALLAQLKRMKDRQGAGRLGSAGNRSGAPLPHIIVPDEKQ